VPLSVRELLARPWNIEGIDPFPDGERARGTHAKETDAMTTLNPTHNSSTFPAKFGDFLASTTLALAGFLVFFTFSV
jgi:hypothetical protein